MMRGKIRLSVIASFIIYVLLAATLLLSIPFMVTWGSEKSWYIQLVIFAQGFPFELTSKDGVIHWVFVLLNALFWTILFTVILYLVALIITKKTKETQ